MNDTITSILKRRSCKSFTEKKVSHADLEQIIMAGIYAPSASNKQPWHITVISDAKLLDRIVDVAVETMLVSDNDQLIKRASVEGYHTFYHAPTVVIISGEEIQKYASVDCGLALENMAIAAQSLGIGSCFIASVHPAFTGKRSKELINELGIPVEFKPLYALAIGYSLEINKEAAPRRENTVNYID